LDESRSTVWAAYAVIFGQPEKIRGGRFSHREECPDLPLGSG